VSKKVVQLIAATANLFVDSTLMYSVVFDDSTDVTTLTIYRSNPGL